LGFDKRMAETIQVILNTIFEWSERRSR